jgi:hypothetical protein
MDKIRHIEPKELRAEYAHAVSKVSFEYGCKYVFLIDFGNNYYKFGKSMNVSKRLQDLFNKHHYYSVLKLWKCGEYLCAVEKCIKTYAKSKGILETYRGENDVIRIDNITTVNTLISYIDDIVSKIPNNNISDNDFYILSEDTLTKMGINKILIKRKKCAGDKVVVNKEVVLTDIKCHICGRTFSGKNCLANHMKVCGVKLKQDTNVEKIDEMCQWGQIL